MKIVKKIFKTGVKAGKEDIMKLTILVSEHWQAGRSINFSPDQSIAPSLATIKIKQICHQMALDYGLPEIKGYYGIDLLGEFCRYEDN